MADREKEELEARVRELELKAVGLGMLLQHTQEELRQAEERERSRKIYIVELPHWTPIVFTNFEAAKACIKHYSEYCKGHSTQYFRDRAYYIDRSLHLLNEHNMFWDSLEYDDDSSIEEEEITAVKWRPLYSELTESLKQDFPVRDSERDARLS